MIFQDTYRLYFKHQAENHPSLAHQDLTGERVFQMIGVEEALGDFRTGVKEKAFIMRLLNYNYSIGDAGEHETKKFLEGGFIIARHFSGRAVGTADYYEAMDDSEQVVDEVIEKMLADSRNGHPLWYHSLDSRQNIRVNPRAYTGDASYAGWLVTFSWSNRFRDCITSDDAPAWIDGGLTPYE